MIALKEGASEAERIAAIANPAARQVEIERWVEGYGPEFDTCWRFWSRDAQRPRRDDWRVWLLLAGRGFGKTRAGAEWVRRFAGENGSARIALVGATMSEARAVMVEGPSGVLAVCPRDNRPKWEPSLGRLTWPNGAQAALYSAAEPDSLRGPEHHAAWADEIAKWSEGIAAWDNLTLGLRKGARPRVVATTTPRPVPLVRRLMAEPGVLRTQGRTADNHVHLGDGFVEAVTGLYAGTRLGRQELDGELIEEVEGALWTRALIEERRARAPETLRRVLVGVDPPASAAGDACGIVACGLGGDGIGYVLGDHSVSGRSPEGWARAVAAAAEVWGAERVIVETNQGGEMVESVLRSADVMLPVRPVRARFGKSQRAEPVAALFEGGKARFVGAFLELEDELTGILAGGGYEGPGRSPDRADAMVWAMAELMLGRARAPRVRGL